MRLPSRRSLAEARIALGPFDRFLVLYGALFAAFGVASPFLPALLHERGLGPSQIGAVLAAGTAVRLITGPLISRLADRLGKHQQNPGRIGLHRRRHRVRLWSSGGLCDLPHCQCRARCGARPVPIRVGARCGFGCLRRGRGGRWSGCPGNKPRRHRMDERDDACARRRSGAATTPKCAGSASGATASKRSRLVSGARLLASHGAGGPGSRQPRAARWLRGVALAGGGIGPSTAGLLWSEGVLAEVVVFVVVGPTLLRWLGPAGAAALAASGAGIIRWSVTAITAWPRRWCSWNRCMV